MGMFDMAALLTWLGFRRWSIIDRDGPFELQESQYGERRTIVRGHQMRRLPPDLTPRWE